MQELETITLVKHPRVTVRISSKSLSFAVVDNAVETQVAYEPFTAKSGMSIAANMREAFRTAALLGRDYQRAQILLDANVLMIPVEEFDESTKEALYRHSFPNADNDIILQSIVPNLNGVAVFGINKDLKMVIEDHFQDVRYTPVAQPVWSYMHNRSFSGSNRKLYGYFHDDKLEIFSFDKNRFKFCNCYDTNRANDAVYFLLYVWKQLALDAEKDELCIAGEVPDREQTMATLKKYVRQAYFINPAGEFNRAPITQVKGITLDLITLFLKGK